MHRVFYWFHLLMRCDETVSNLEPDYLELVIGSQVLLS